MATRQAYTKEEQMANLLAWQKEYYSTEAQLARKAEVMSRNTVCSRCNGTGRIACYNHVAQGVCFKCGGTGK